jgi:hypothetical protein
MEIVAALAAVVAAAVAVAVPGAILPDIARAVGRVWVALISLAWQEPQRSRHREERLSMVEEALIDDKLGRAAAERAILVLIRLVAGIPGDVLWAARGVRRRLPERRSRPISMRQIGEEEPELWATVRGRMFDDLFRSRPGLNLLARDIGPGVALERYLAGSRDNAEAAVRLAKLVVESNAWRQHDSMN